MWTLLHAGALGDLVLTLQLALRLPRVREDGRLHVVSRVNPGDLAECRPQITRQSTEGVGLHWLYVDSAEAPPERLRDLIQGRRILSALSDPDSLVHRRLLALNPQSLFSFDPRPRDIWAGHITDQWRHDLETQGLLISKCAYRTREDGLRVPNAWPKPETAAILIHPGGGGREKCWPLACFLETARLLRQGGSTIHFLLGPVECERWPAAQIQQIATEFPTVVSPPPDELLKRLAAARVLISNDSGPAHLAALFGTPTVTLFGPTSPARWRPLGRRGVVAPGDPQNSAADWGIAPAHVAALAARH